MLRLCLSSSIVHLRFKLRDRDLIAVSELKLDWASYPKQDEGALGACSFSQVPLD